MSAERVTFWVGIATLVLGLLAFIAAWHRERRARLAERPVLICHERKNRQFAPGDGWECIAEVENASARYAINVRFGVELNGVRFPWRHAKEDEDGSRWNVLAPGEKTGGLPVGIPSVFNWSGGGDPDPGRAYWCSYESVAGEVWETRNPWERTNRFEICRVRSVRWERWRSRRGRRRALDRGTANLRRGIEELQAGREELERRDS